MFESIDDLLLSDVYSQEQQGYALLKLIYAWETWANADVRSETFVVCSWATPNYR